MLTISDGYLETMGARLVRGRGFSPFDTSDTSNEVPPMSPVMMRS